METIVNTSTASLNLTGVVPAVCDAEAGQQHSSKSELVKANPSTGVGSSTTAFPQATTPHCGRSTPRGLTTNSKFMDDFGKD
jgi:hypothetical protein